MTLDASFLTLMPSTVKVYPTATTDSYGKQTWSGVSVDTRAYVQETGVMITTADNQNVFEQGRVIFYGNPTIVHSSKMELPDGKTPRIISIREYTDTTFPQITIVSFGS